MTLINAEKLQDVRYIVMDLPENELLAAVRAMTREELIEALGGGGETGHNGKDTEKLRPHT